MSVSCAGRVACVEGIDMLIMQGYGQLRLWAEKFELTPVVRANVAQNVRKYYESSR